MRNHMGANSHELSAPDRVIEVAITIVIAKTQITRSAVMYKIELQRAIG